MAKQENENKKYCKIIIHRSYNDLSRLCYHTKNRAEKHTSYIPENDWEGQFKEAKENQDEFQSTTKTI